jgi:hypothetical protein
MIIGMERAPFLLYTPIDGQWAKWNAEAILHFGKLFDLSPHNMLAGMGSMYLPNLPWLNPGALALALPFSEATRDIISYCIYAAELAVSLVLLARAIGFCWPLATVAAQAHLYLLFPPFSEVFQVFNWYSLIPASAHLTALLNLLLVAALHCGASSDWRRNLAWVLGIAGLFICGLLSAPLTFIFMTPPYVVMAAALILARRPAPAEWAWRSAAVLACLAFVVVSGLPDYYLGTAATSARTPPAPAAWDHLLSLRAWYELIRDHSICVVPWGLLCTDIRGGWLQIAGCIGALAAGLTRRGRARTAAWTMLGYIALAHVYTYAYQVGWLGAASVLSNHFLLFSNLTFVCIFAASAPLDLFKLVKQGHLRVRAHDKAKGKAIVAVGASLGVLLALAIVRLLEHPYTIYRYQMTQLATAALAIAAVIAAAALLRRLRPRNERNAGLLASTPAPILIAILSIFPILALTHLSIGFHKAIPAVSELSLTKHLRENAAIDLGGKFRGYVSTVWTDAAAKMIAPPGNVFGDIARYVYGRDYFRSHYGQSFAETDLWRLDVPTIEEYGQWSSMQAQRFFLRFLVPRGVEVNPSYLRAYRIDGDILRLLGVRYLVTDTETVDGSAVLRDSATAPGAVAVRLFELGGANLGTYSPTRFVNATAADEVLDRIAENKHRLDEVAVTSEQMVSSGHKARNLVITVERDGFRVRADSDGPVHVILPLQFSRCLVIVNGAAARLSRVNLFQTLMSFEGAIDARVEFRFGLFADNSCRVQDGLDNKRLGL